jgi:sec-independent protein translocase protein TatB
MFDIGFSEIVVIGVTALVVIGPERLPKVARTLGHMFGRLQRYVNEVKSDINREMELDELRKLRTEVKDAARDIEQSVSKAATDFESSVRSVGAELNEAAAGAVASPAAANTPDAGMPPLPPLEEPPAVDAAPHDPPPSSEAPRQPTLPGFDRI